MLPNDEVLRLSCDLARRHTTSELALRLSGMEPSPQTPATGMHRVVGVLSRVIAAGTGLSMISAIPAQAADTMATFPSPDSDASSFSALPMSPVAFEGVDTALESTANVSALASTSTPELNFSLAPDKPASDSFSIIEAAVAPVEVALQPLRQPETLLSASFGPHDEEETRPAGYGAHTRLAATSAPLSLLSFRATPITDTSPLPEDIVRIDTTLTPAAKPDQPKHPSPLPAADKAPVVKDMPTHDEILKDMKRRHGDTSGQLGRSELEPLGKEFGSHSLHPAAAEAYRAMDAAFVHRFKHHLGITDSYRSLAEQRRVAAEKPDLAATPGKSEHGWGMALDLKGIKPGNKTDTWLHEHGPFFGWEHPDWAEPNGSKPEPWHWEYNDPTYDNPTGSKSISNATSRPPSTPEPEAAPTDVIDFSTPAVIPPTEVIDATLAILPPPPSPSNTEGVPSPIHTNPDSQPSDAPSEMAPDEHAVLDFSNVDIPDELNLQLIPFDESTDTPPEPTPEPSTPNAPPAPPKSPAEIKTTDPSYSPSVNSIMKLFPRAKREYVERDLPGLMHALHEYDLDSPELLAYAFATLSVEDPEFRPVREYSRGRGHTYGRPDSTTGEIYYGRGKTQLTWKSNYAEYGKKIGEDLVHHPDLMLNPDIDSKVFARFMADRKGTLRKAIKSGRLADARAKYNGGHNGLSAFERRYVQALKIFD